MRGSQKIQIKSEHEMSAFGAMLAAALGPGSTVLLSGPIGAGKTHLARSMIQSLLPFAEDVPSPTYTLVQTYHTNTTDIWHADLYRLADSSELVELGLDEAFSTAIVIVEWPDRLPNEMVPRSAISIEIRPMGGIRYLTISGPEGPIDDVVKAHANA